jgi:hypothetical protein
MRWGSRVEPSKPPGCGTEVRRVPLLIAAHAALASLTMPPTVEPALGRPMSQIGNDQAPHAYGRQGANTAPLAAC